MENENEVAQLVRRNEGNYLKGDVTISKYVKFNLAETVNNIDAYLNSKHISGKSDNLGREKPFLNICVPASNIWQRATDIDRKHIQVRPSKPGQMFLAFLATEKLREYMRRDNFGQWINDWGSTLARYGSAVSKFVKKDGKLHASVVPWNRLIVDPVSFDGDVVIEVLEFSNEQLASQPGYDKEAVRKIIEDSNETRKNLDRTTKDTKSGYTRVYEVHGMMPLSFITGNEDDEYEYVQQMWVVAYTKDEKSKKDKYNDYVLAGGREEKHPYHIAHLIKEDGRTLARGAVENLFEAQWMINHSVKLTKDQLDLASKLIFQTSDETFVGQNALSAVETGDILIHKDNKPLTQIQNNSHDTTAIQNFATSWKSAANEINGISEAMLGQNAPSGTAWRQVEALLNESHSMFELMTENKGLALVEILRTFVIPYIKTTLSTDEEIVAALEGSDIEMIDVKLTPALVRKKLLSKVIDQITQTGDFNPFTEKDIADATSSVKSMLKENGSTRYFKPSDISGVKWSEVFKDLEWELEIDVTNESRDVQNDMATLSTVLQTLSGNPGILDNPAAKLVFERIVSMTGAISPVEISSAVGSMKPNNAGGAMGGALPTGGTPNMAPQMTTNG